MQPGPSNPLDTRSAGGESRPARQVRDEGVQTSTRKCPAAPRRRSCTRTRRRTAVKPSDRGFRSENRTCGRTAPCPRRSLATQPSGTSTKLVASRRAPSKAAPSAAGMTNPHPELPGPLKSLHRLQYSCHDPAYLPLYLHLYNRYVQYSYHDPVYLPLSWRRVICRTELVPESHWE